MFSVVSVCSGYVLLVCLQVAERGLISLSETSKSNDGSEINIMFANVTPNPNIPHCKVLRARIVAS